MAPTTVLPLVLMAVPLVIALSAVTDLAQAQQVRGLPCWGWAVFIPLSVPLGALCYLLFGKER